VEQEPLTPLFEGVFRASDPVSVVGTALCRSMTVVRLPDGSVLVHSPVNLTPERRAAVEALGPVRHLYAPNLFHHLNIGDWAAAFPSARVHAPRGLQKKRPDLRIDRVIGETPEPEFEGVVDEIPISGFRLNETALFHGPSSTLLVADLVHNVGRPAGTWTKLYTSAMGFYDRVALSRAIRWTAFSDRDAARRSVDRLLTLPFERLAVGHGTPLGQGSKQALSEAFSWLP
jgi:hypothetical protein